MTALTIAKAARQAGVGIETVRFYERRGLIEQPPKTQDSGFRVYSPEQIKRIKFIRQAQQIGFSLHEIHELLSLRADPAADCSAVRSQAVAKLEEVKRKIAELGRIGSALEALIAVCPGHGGLQVCTILDAIADSTHPVLPPMTADDPSSTTSPKRKSHTDRCRPDQREHKKARESTVKSVTLKIEGMNCDGCAATLKALLQRESGVKTAAVTFEDGEARILYDPATIDEERLVTMVEGPGYRVTSRAP